MGVKKTVRPSTKRKVVESLGGGWYMLPNGKKMRGRAASLATAERLAVSHGSTLTGRLRFMNQAGLQYKGNRNVFETAGYVQEGSETFDNYWAKYERDPIAGRIVDMPAKTTWKTPPEVFEGEAEKEVATDFEKQWDELVKRVRVWKHFENVDRLSRIGKYAVLLIGYRGGDDTDLQTPVEQMMGQSDVLYLSSFSEKYATIDQWDQDPLSARFGLPKVYSIDLSSGVEKFKAKKVSVHHSRLIHVAEDTLTDDVFGRPALKRALNAMDDLLKVTASTGEAYWQLAARMLVGKVDPQAELAEGMIGEMGEAMEEMVHDLRRQFIGQGVEMDWLKGEVPKPGDALEVYKQLMGAASGIPTRVLFGSEQGQLASSQDERAYFGMINERQEHHAEPNILRSFIDSLILSGGLAPPKSKEEGYNVVWPPLFEMTERDMAEANKARAETAKALTAVGNDPIDLVEIDENRNVWLRTTEDVLRVQAERSDEEKREMEAELEEERRLREEAEAAVGAGVEPPIAGEEE